MSRVVDVRVPDMGSFKDVTIIDVLVKAGDSVEVETPLITLETEKATMDVPSTASGIVERVAVSKGGQVNAGDVVVAVRTDAKGDGSATASTGETQPASAAPQAASGSGGAAPARDAPASAPPAPAEARQPAGASSAPGRSPPPATSVASVAPFAAKGAQVAPSPVADRGFSEAHASPSVRKLARELGVPLGSVRGTGFKGRITDADLKAFVKSALESGAAARGAAPAPGLPSVPAVDYAQFGPTEVKPLSRIQRISGQRLHASWVNIPHVTQFDEADITTLEALRAELRDKAASRGIKLTPLAFILRACVKALQEFPQFNASLDPSLESLTFRKYIHIGFAADTPNGLLVPVVRDADRKDIYELARTASELAGKARAGTLTLAEMQGGCFTVSSLGGIGGTAFTPIINAPEVAILGVSRSALRPVFVDGAFLPRLMLPLSLSYDHRVIDGALAVRFTTFLAHALADARGLAEAVP
jgi:pyruvate dehydrogenase E2 component (dihydrolipoyllysine-residue acetyltransferase)